MNEKGILHCRNCNQKIEHKQIERIVRKGYIGLVFKCLKCNTKKELIFGTEDVERNNV